MTKPWGDDDRKAVRESLARAASSVERLKRAAAGKPDPGPMRAGDVLRDVMGGGPFAPDLEEFLDRVSGR